VPTLEQLDYNITTRNSCYCYCYPVGGWDILFTNLYRCSYQFW